MWKDILKQDKERENAEIALKEAITQWGLRKDISDFADLSERYNLYLYNSDITGDVTLEMVDEDRYGSDPKSVIEDDAGYFLGHLSNSEGDFAEFQYTYNGGFELLEYNFKKLSVEEMRQYVEDLDGN